MKGFFSFGYKLSREFKRPSIFIDNPSKITRRRTINFLNLYEWRREGIVSWFHPEEEVCIPKTAKAIRGESFFSDRVSRAVSISPDSYLNRWDEFQAENLPLLDSWSMRIWLVEDYLPVMAVIFVDQAEQSFHAYLKIRMASDINFQYEVFNRAKEFLMSSRQQSLENSSASFFSEAILFIIILSLFNLLLFIWTAEYIYHRKIPPHNSVCLPVYYLQRLFYVRTEGLQDIIRCLFIGSILVYCGHLAATVSGLDYFYVAFALLALVLFIIQSNYLIGDIVVSRRAFKETERIMKKHFEKKISAVKKGANNSPEQSDSNESRDLIVLQFYLAFISLRAVFIFTNDCFGKALIVNDSLGQKDLIKFSESNNSLSSMDMLFSAGIWLAASLESMSSRQVGYEFRKLIKDGVELKVAGEARKNPMSLLSKGYTPKYKIELFDTTYYLTNLKADDDERFFIGYVLQRHPKSGKNIIYARYFYKDYSLIWRSASHYHGTRKASSWLGKGDMKAVVENGEEVFVSMEETTNLPYEIQSTLDELSTRASLLRQDAKAVRLVLRRAPNTRPEPYQDFVAPRRDAAQRIQPVNRGRKIAYFTRKGNPRSLRFAKGFEPDYHNGLVEVSTDSGALADLYGGEVKKYRFLSKNKEVCYQFLAAPNIFWVNPPQAAAGELTSYGVRPIDVNFDDNAFLSGLDYYEEPDPENSVAGFSQIPQGYAGKTNDILENLSDTSKWNDKLPHIRVFKRKFINRFVSMPEEISNQSFSFLVLFISFVPIAAVISLRNKRYREEKLLEAEGQYNYDPLLLSDHEICEAYEEAVDITNLENQCRDLKPTLGQFAECLPLILPERMSRKETQSIAQRVLDDYNLRNPQDLLLLEGQKFQELTLLEEEVVNFIQARNYIVSWEELITEFGADTIANVKTAIESKSLSFYADRHSFHDGELTEPILLVYRQEVIDRLLQIIEIIEDGINSGGFHLPGISSLKSLAAGLGYSNRIRSITIFKGLDGDLFIKAVNHNRRLLDERLREKQILIKLIEPRIIPGVCQVLSVLTSSENDGLWTRHEIADKLPGLSYQDVNRYCRRINNDIGYDWLNYNGRILGWLQIIPPLTQTKQKTAFTQVLRVLEELGGVATAYEIGERLSVNYKVITQPETIKAYMTKMRPLLRAVNARRRKRGIFELRQLLLKHDDGDLESRSMSKLSGFEGAEKGSDIYKALGVVYRHYVSRFRFKSYRRYRFDALPEIYRRIFHEGRGRRTSRNSDFFQEVMLYIISHAPEHLKNRGSLSNLALYFSVGVIRALNMTGERLNRSNFAMFRENLERVVDGDYPLIKSDYAPGLDESGST
ncbi:MAG: hypothetical protein JW867_09225, partial [Candidatus Omnitrophica bacterium]|nr:hypothetical protein [Candidatus Omnitrophota bacterium]